MKIYLARHGETDWNVQLRMQGTTDIELNENGLAQAVRLGERMESRGITRVYTSHLKRASRTAQIVAKHLGVSCEECEGLQELSLGHWEGMSWLEVCEKYPELAHQWETAKRFTRPPEGETNQEMIDRVVCALVRIAREAQGNVMVVTHNACMRAFLAELNQTPLETMSRDYVTPNAQALEVDAEKVLRRFG